MSRNFKGSISQYIQVAVTFGLTTGARIYILGILGGNWVDQKLGTSPWFMLTGVLLAIFLSFKFLLNQVSRNDQDDKEE